jgi:hypothetical protein
MGGMTSHPQGQLLAYVERRLEPAARAKLESHLAGCAGCRDQAADLASTMDELEALPLALRAVPSRASANWPAVWSRVRRAGGPIGPAARRLAPRFSVYLSLAAAALSATLVWPGSFAAGAGAVTAGVVETPHTTVHTPHVVASRQTPVVAPQGTAVTAGLLAVPVGPAATETPAPGAGG